MSKQLHGSLRSTRTAGLVIAASAFVIALAYVAIDFGATAGPRESIYPSRSSLAEIEADTAHLEGPRNIILPDYDEIRLDDGELERHGPFRLIPAGFVGTVTHENITPPWEDGVESSDPRVIERSPLYVPLEAPADLGLRLVALDTGIKGTSGRSVRYLFRSDDGAGQIEVLRTLPLLRPLDVSVPSDTAALALWTDVVAGHYAVGYGPSPAFAEEPNAFFSVQVFDGLVLTIVEGSGPSIDDETLLAFAERIVRLGEKQE